MKVLIIGNGGREHALAWKAAQAASVSHVYVAPGNAGTAGENQISNINIGVEDIKQLVAFAAKEEIGLTIVGPEAPLVIGVVDAFTAAGLECFGPTRNAAQLEGSKAFTKDFLHRHNIPTAGYQVFTNADAACKYIAEKGAPVVVKADGLAAGKGVIIAKTVEQAQSAARDMLIDNKFGNAGAQIVVEEFLAGEEASFICMVDGNNILPLATSQDHKARDNGDLGPNTGGMGAYSPAPVVTAAMHTRIMNEIIKPTVAGMHKDGCPYTGFLYAGIMIAPDGTPKVLEYNCRFGDPETQPIMLRLKSDLVELCLAALDKRLDKITAEWDERVALGVVLATSGYPDNYAKGLVISGLDNCNTDNCKTFQAGTSLNNGHIVTSGGRVLCVTALGSSVTEAQKLAYASVNKISWEGMFYRTDIGHQGIAREQ